MEILLIYLAVINLLAFIISGLDKRAAIRNKWRVPEKTLFILAVLGGSIGLYLSMYLFRHKTKHLKFTIGVPVIILLQIALAWFIYSRLQ